MAIESNNFYIFWHNKALKTLRNITMASEIANSRYLKSSLLDLIAIGH